MNSKERLEEILLYLKISANKLSKEIGHRSNVKIQHVKSGRNELSAEVASEINTRYPEFNFKWLTSGEGNMLNNSEDVFIAINHKKAKNLIQSEGNLSVVMERLALYEEKIDFYKERIEKLEEENQSLKKDQKSVNPSKGISTSK